MDSGRPRIDASLVALVAEGFLSRLSFGVVGFALPLFAHRLGMSLASIGLLTSVSVAVEMLLKPLLGAWVDRFGLKRGLGIAICIRSLVALLLAFAGSPWQLFAIRTLHGAAESLRDPSVNALLAEGSNRQAVASAFAWYSTAKNAAGSIGKAVGGVLLTLTLSNYSLVFAIAFVLSALPLVAVGRYIQDPGSHERGDLHLKKEPRSVDEASHETPAARISLLPFVGLGALISGTAAMLQSLFPILATQYAHLTEAQAGLVYAISTAVTIFAGPAFGWISDHVSRRLVLAVRSVANTVSSLVYVVFPTFPGVATAKIVDDTGKAAFRPAWGALMAQISGFDRSKRARTMGLLSLGENVGEAGGPLLAGFIWQTWGIVPVLLVRATLAVFTEVYAFLLPKPREEPHPPRKADLLQATALEVETEP